MIPSKVEQENGIATSRHSKNLKYGIIAATGLVVALSIGALSTGSNEANLDTTGSNEANLDLVAHGRSQAMCDFRNTGNVFGYTGDQCHVCLGSQDTDVTFYNFQSRWNNHNACINELCGTIGHTYANCRLIHGGGKTVCAFTFRPGKISRANYCP